jgi:molybdopterin converting factor small subunit
MTPDPPPAALRIALFAGMAELAGRRELELPWTGGTVAELLAAVQAACPVIAPLAARSAVAIGDRYAAATDPVAAGDRVAIIPPVSGG